jgi:hypothetical protein
MCNCGRDQFAPAKVLILSPSGYRAALDVRNERRPRMYIGGGVLLLILIIVLIILLF